MTGSEFARKLHAASCILSILSRNLDFNPEKRWTLHSPPAAGPYSLMPFTSAKNRAKQARGTTCVFPTLAIVLTDFAGKTATLKVKFADIEIMTRGRSVSAGVLNVLDGSHRVTGLYSAQQMTDVQLANLRVKRPPVTQNIWVGIQPGMVSTFLHRVVGGGERCWSMRRRAISCSTRTAPTR